MKLPSRLRFLTYVYLTHSNCTDIELSLTSIFGKWRISKLCIGFHFYPENGGSRFRRYIGERRTTFFIIIAVFSNVKRRLRRFALEVEISGTAATHTASLRFRVNTLRAASVFLFCFCLS
jgi:hypothetical protein